MHFRALMVYMGNCNYGFSISLDLVISAHFEGQKMDVLLSKTAFD